MASPSEKSSSSRSTNTLMPGRIVIAYDATKNYSSQEFKEIITNIQMRGGMIQEVDTITVVGVLHKVLHPMGFQIQIDTNSFIGTRVRAIKEEVSKMVDTYVRKLHYSTEECAGNGVIVEVKIVVGAPLKNVVVQEAVSSNATWVVLNRHLRKELRFYLKHIPCKVALTLDNFTVEVLRGYYSDKATNVAVHKVFYSLSKVVPLLPVDYDRTDYHSVISPSYHGSMSSQEGSDSEKSSIVSSLTSKSKRQIFSSPDEFGSNLELERSGSYGKVKDRYDNSPPVKRKQIPRSSSDVPVRRTASEMKPKVDITARNNSEIEIATDDFSFENSQGEDADAKVEVEPDESHPVMPKQRNLHMEFDETKMGLDSRGCSYSEIQMATNDFSSDNLLGEGGYGDAYKGQLKDGRLVIVKVQKGANAQGLSDLDSELCLLSLASHKNIVMLLGYCHKENLNILVYEYICNKSLDRHLFDNTEHVLAWHQRHAIAIGIAKGLRYLHEECRGSPIIHRDIRPSNIFLTHEFVPLLGDCGLAKWGTNKSERQTKILGTLEYLAPEYAENGICSAKTDIFAFGIVLIQLISGCKAVDSARDNHHKSLRQWAMPLIQTLALDELVDPCLGDLNSTYELYQMARAAYLCLQTKPAMRPTIGEVIHLLEGKNDHQRHLTEKLIPHITNVQTPALLQALMV